MTVKPLTDKQRAVLKTAHDMGLRVYYDSARIRKTGAHERARTRIKGTKAFDLFSPALEAFGYDRVRLYTAIQYNPLGRQRIEALSILREEE